jgi:hypothetical protein
MFTNMKIALASAMILGSAYAALANDIDDNVSAAQAERESRQAQLPWWWQGQNQTVNGATAYGAYGFAPRTPKGQHR